MYERLDTREQQMTMKLPELPWIASARQYIGLREVPGPKTNGVIAGWLTKLKAWWADDATPWCGTFAAMCVAEAGLTPPKEWYRATAWLTLPVSLPGLPMAASWCSRGRVAGMSVSWSAWTRRAT